MKKSITSLLVVLLNVSIIMGQESFITKWVSPDGSITIPTYEGSNYNYNITWVKLSNPLGSETVSGIKGDYTIEGLVPYEAYRIEINGTFPRIYFNGCSGSDEIVEVSQWGSLQWTSFNSAFQGCRKLILTATDVPDLSKAHDMHAAFYQCLSLRSTSAINSWDVSIVKDMGELFYGTDVFNQDIGNWDVRNVEDMSYMFYGDDYFNQEIGGWDVSNVTDMRNMFTYAASFNQDLSGWDVSNVKNMKGMFRGAVSYNKPLNNWNVSEVEDMAAMFAFADAFNQYIAGWDVSNVSNMTNMFYSATAFNQNLSRWDLNNLEEARNMFDSPVGKGIKCNNFGKTIKGWALNLNTAGDVLIGVKNRVIPENYQLYKGTLEYSKYWTFSDSVSTRRLNNGIVE